ncbi:MAG: putative ABC transporter permease [Fastidiosipila sp.]|nr:putative ABC transporter permease [Fastidiosipila sp.]
MNNLLYKNVFWLFMLGNVLGVLVEGFWCLLWKGEWETHTVAMWGPFNIVYGIGLPVFYIGSILLDGARWARKFSVNAIIGSLVEYICGLFIRIGIRMKAWDYSGHFMNIQGIISLKMAFLWGLVGTGYNMFLHSPVEKLLSLINGTFWDLAGLGLAIFMILNLTLTAACIIRWSNRHFGKSASSQLSRWLDEKYPDSIMQEKFFYWSFIEEGSADNVPVRSAE